MAAATGIDDGRLVSHAARRRAADIAFAAVVAAVLGYGLYSMLAYIAAGQQGLGVLGQAFRLGFLRFLRVAVVVAVASVIWLPVGVWIGFNPRIAAAWKTCPSAPRPRPPSRCPSLIPHSIMRD